MKQFEMKKIVIQNMKIMIIEKSTARKGYIKERRERHASESIF